MEVGRNMPIEWTINHSSRLVTAVCNGEVSRIEIEDYLDKVVTSDALPYAKIFDTTGATLALDDEDMMSLGARIRAYDGISDMGPLALVASSAESHNRARQFANLGGANRLIRILSTVGAAQRWLEAQSKADDRPAGPAPRLRGLLMTL
jgi:hypothetical protein